VRITRLGPEHWRQIRSVRLQALRESPDAFASSVDEELARPDDWWIDGATRLAWFVAEVGDEVVGVVAGLPTPEGPEVISMWVEPGHRGTDVADRLLQAVVDWAREEGWGSLCLAVAGGNDRARRFYERAGFTVVGPGEPLRSRPEVCTTEMRLVLESED